MSRRALVADPSVPVAGTIKRYLEGAGYSVKVARHQDEALAQIGEGEPDVVFAAATELFDGEALCAQVKLEWPLVPFVLVYPPEADDPDADAMRCGADAYVVGPLKRGTVVSVAKTVGRIRTLLDNVHKLEADLKSQPASADDSGGALGGAPPDFEFFKKFLLMEVKRSRRYKYPVSFLLIGLDHFEQRTAGLEPLRRGASLTEALAAVTKGIRDIDLAVPFSEARYLVFLPHTPVNGARVVAERLKDRLAKLETVPELTASIGVAAYEPGISTGEVSFGSLLKQASEMLRGAQAAGGNRVEAAERKEKRSRISIG